MEQLNKTKAINTASPRVRRIEPDVAKITFYESGKIILNQPLARMFNVDRTMYLHFWDAPITWQFVANTDKLGFKVSQNGGKDIISYRLNSRALVRIFKEHWKKALPATFYVNKSPTVELDGVPAGYFDITKSVEELLKQ